MANVFQLAGNQWPEMKWYETDQYIAKVPAHLTVPEDEPGLHIPSSHLCFLQYTSGSTSFPKVGSMQTKLSSCQMFSYSIDHSIIQSISEYLCVGSNDHSSKSMGKHLYHHLFSQCHTTRRRCELVTPSTLSIHSSIHSFIHSFIHPFIHSFIHSSIHPLTHLINQSSHVVS